MWRTSVLMVQHGAVVLGIALFVSTLLTRAAWAQDTSGGELAAQEALPVAGYSNGFFIQSSDGDYRLRIKGRVQLRLTGLFPEEGDSEAAFMIRRARLRFFGNLFEDRVSYLVQIAYELGWVSVADFWADIEAVPDRLYVRLGQFKRPFSREQLLSGGRMQLVERSFLQGFFGTGRDVGLALHNDFESGPPFEWVVAAVNGTGVRATLDGDVNFDPETGVGDIVAAAFSNVPRVFHPAVIARVGYNRGDVRASAFPDLDGGPIRLALGVSGWLDFDVDGGDDGFVAVDVDALLKTRGFSLFAEAVVSAGQDGESFSDLSYSAWATTIEAGYVIGGFVQPAVRFTHLDPRDDANNRDDVTAGISFYFIDHALKWQTDASALLAEGDGGAEVDWRVRSQVQLWF